MRGLVALVVALAVASLSGCVELVGEEDPELQAAAEDAAKALDEHRNKVGHISGLVVGLDGAPIAGALVDLVTVAQVTTDDAGRFSFLDLTPGEYSLAAEATEHLASSVDVDVAAGQYTRPRIELEVAPDESYYEVHRLEGYRDFSLLGWGLMSCYSCSIEGELGGEGLAEVVIEGELGEQSGPFGGAYDFFWEFSASNENESSSFGGYEASPMRVSIPGDEIVEGADYFHGHFEPASSLVDFGQAFTVIVSLFYHDVAPEGYTGFETDE